MKKFVRRRRFNRRRGRKLNPRQKMQVKKLITVRQELKYIGQNQALTNISTTPTIVDLTLIAQGSTDSERDGDRLMLCGKLDIRASFLIPSTLSADLYDTVRYIVFQWHPNSLPTAANILLNDFSGAVGPYSQYSHDNRQQYKILFDKTMNLVGPGQNPAAGPSVSLAPLTSLTHRTIHARISLKKATKQLQYAAGGTTGTNHLYILQVSDSTLATHPAVGWSSKLFFRDS